MGAAERLREDIGASMQVCSPFCVADTSRRVGGRAVDGIELDGTNLLEGPTRDSSATSGEEGGLETGEL
jgi:hypothetical protein